MKNLYLLLFLFLGSSVFAQTTKLYGINNLSLKSFDPSTGALTTICTHPFLNTFTNNNWTYNSVKKHYVFLGFKVYSFDVNTGAIVNQPTDSSGITMGLEYNCKNGKLYALSDSILVNLDPLTGKSTPISTILHGDFVTGFDAVTFNSDLEHYVFYANGRIYSVDVNTGNIVYNPTVPDQPVGLRYNCRDSTYYAISNNNLVAINPVTGQFTNICSNPNFNVFTIGIETVDPANGHYYYFGSNFYNINVTNGSINTLPAASIMAIANNRCCSLVNNTEVESSDLLPEISVYPNPASEYLIVSLKSFQSYPFNLSIFDLTGKLMYRSLIEKETTKIDVSNLSSGMYFIEVAETNFRTKFYKQ
jgi:outer membrane protein assembly factor BamB